MKLTSDTYEIISGIENYCFMIVHWEMFFMSIVLYILIGFGCFLSNYLLYPLYTSHSWALVILRIILLGFLGIVMGYLEITKLNGDKAKSIHYSPIYFFKTLILAVFVWFIYFSFNIDSKIIENATRIYLHFVTNVMFDASYYPYYVHFIYDNLIESTALGAYFILFLSRNYVIYMIKHNNPNESSTGLA